MGFSRRDITPDFPVPLAGYLVSRVSRGVHDRLYARALAFDGREASGPVVLLQLDLLNLDSICMNRIHEGIAAFGLRKDQLLVCAIHTHSGFGGIFDPGKGINRELEPLLGAPDPRLADLVVRESLSAVEEALAERVETMVRIRRGVLEGLGTNRHDPDLPCDKSLLLIEFCRMDYKKILLYSTGCHPTVLNGENLLLSADFAGAVAGKLEKSGPDPSPPAEFSLSGKPGGDVSGRPDGYDLVIFINGAAGDMSTRFTRNESSFAECGRYADLILGAIEGLKKGVFLPLERVTLRYHTAGLCRATIQDEKNAEERLKESRQTLETLRQKEASPKEIRRAESFVEGAQINLLTSRHAKGHAGLNSETGCTGGEEIPVETGILRINASVIVCVPFELFSTLALMLKREKQADVFGYANVLRGYLADRESYDNMEYEALSSEFRRGEGERYIELVTALL
ncbi:MAG: neutral/alkaline non-lysosomal ceramidase N-terminal domain-containing protein [Spirochaetaceae bacterium]|nr:neutral/alkaline non-lysosomal ceramidase N-terminal domain-containing protein [Spirochaetaceae bacterium]